MRRIGSNLGKMMKLWHAVEVVTYDNFGITCLGAADGDESVNGVVLGQDRKKKKKKNVCQSKR